ncbi:hypothetical protein JOD43_001743 [Pullulanibacillus pueri]|uniref:Transcription regulator HTH AraC N-terminal domain-containing protein n=1 Tax=Pullulanibacillus pueri TaxID=1437324 RepID=A0A8J2ZV84_9BACL|nr:AraC family transcriptional regulator [Pullulanibacillus pueri]MBM7681576.1 hypothetical protein [Pullulanibacillus pueri]GGH79606.1 hypothetical protein GCM10007096_14780 [Pullulanibacillus pueri]
MFDQINHLQNELAELIDRHTDRDGYQPTKIPYLGFSRYSTSHYSTLAGPPYGLYNPSIGIVVQGSKDVILGGDRFRYDPSNYFVTSMDLPIIFEALGASSEVPNLSCKIEFTPSLIFELLSLEEFKVTSKKIAKRGKDAAKLDVSMLDAVVRLVRLLDKPVDIPVLAPLYTKEILYKTLHSEHGGSLKK